MIERYTREAMGAIWSEHHKLRTWLQIEIAACKARYTLGYIPESDFNEIATKADFNVAAIAEIETATNHDVIAFLTNVASYVGPASRHIHYGMTSSDVLDTALSLQMKAAGNLLLRETETLIGVLREQGLKHRQTVCIGRTHGVHAEPVTMGLKFALWFEEMKRNAARLTEAIAGISVGKISGAVGTFDHLPPQVEEMVCSELGLSPAPVSTQVLQRDRHAHFLTVLAIAGGTLEKIATEIRHLQRTEVLEAEEYFGKGQKGSSAMPHKRNPITCERIAGLARVLRGNAAAGLENIALWHERDITHSSVERVILPDSCILLDYMLHKTTELIKNLIIYPENMLKNLHATRGLIYSQKVLLALTEAGFTREQAYATVQKHAMRVWRDESLQLFEELLQDAEVTRALGKEKISAIFDSKNGLEHIDEIYRRTIEA